MDSQYAYAPAQVQPQKPALPGTLKAGAILVLLAGVAGVGSLLANLVGGKELLREAVAGALAREFGDSPASLVEGPMMDFALEEAQGVVTARTSVLGFVGVLFLIFGSFIWARMNWARITVIPFALIAFLMWLIDVVDDVPAIFRILDATGMLAMLVALVIVWLPPSNRAFRARKEERRARR
ncbi:hypothetical protein [Nonomuraea longicatena]|uniref:Integral membrane protein n=1 Tax=Nonomuraea longicatena TaxID=83682 RepID=A0ABN1NRW6_9ACTN